MKTPCEGFGCSDSATTCDRHVSKIGDAVWNAALEAAAKVAGAWRPDGMDYDEARAAHSAVDDVQVAIRALKREAR